MHAFGQPLTLELDVPDGDFAAADGRAEAVAPSRGVDPQVAIM
ncbi:hypothetical protein [Lysobacter sp. CA199]